MGAADARDLSDELAGDELPPPPRDHYFLAHINAGLTTTIQMPFRQHFRATALVENRGRSRAHAKTEHHVCSKIRLAPELQQYLE